MAEVLLTFETSNAVYFPKLPVLRLGTKQSFSSSRIQIWAITDYVIFQIIKYQFGIARLVWCQK